MRKRIGTVAGMFLVGTVVATAAARWLPPALEAPIAALIVVVLGTLLLGMAPRVPTDPPVDDRSADDPLPPSVNTSRRR